MRVDVRMHTTKAMRTHTQDSVQYMRAFEAFLRPRRAFYAYISCNYMVTLTSWLSERYFATSFYPSPLGMYLILDLPKTYPPLPLGGGHDSPANSNLYPPRDLDPRSCWITRIQPHLVKFPKFFFTHLLCLHTQRTYDKKPGSKTTSCRYAALYLVCIFPDMVQKIIVKLCNPYLSGVMQPLCELQFPQNV